MSLLSQQGGIVHGFVAAIGPENNPNYFTGATWSALIDDAKVFRTSRGAKCAVHRSEASDSNPFRLSPNFRATMRALPVNLVLEPRLI